MTTLTDTPQQRTGAGGFPFQYQNAGGIPAAAGGARETCAQPTALRPASRARYGAAIVLLLIASGAGMSAWQAFFRYEAYGVVSGNVVEVSASVSGPVQFLHAREGDNVNAGQQLITVLDVETERQLGRIRDELRVAEATLHAEIARLRWNIDVQAVESDRAVSEYLQVLSDLQRESAGLLQNQFALRRVEKLSASGAATEEQLETARVVEDGQQKHVEALRTAVEELQSRAQRVKRLARPGEEQIQPSIAKIDSLMSELKRLEKKLEQRFVSSPISGVVLQRHRSVGEQAELAKPVYSVLEDGSLEVELYIAQEQADAFQPGEQLQLGIEPYSEPVNCEVVRIDDELVPPPASIEHYYHARKPVLRVYLRPVTTPAEQPPLRLGSVVRLSRRWQ